MAGLLTGCATAPDVTTGSLASANGYVLSASEQNWHCTRLENALQARLTAIATLHQQAKSTAEAAAPTVSSLFSRILGKPDDDNPSLTQIKAERAAAISYNEALKAKGCATVDIDAKIAVGTGQSVI